MSSRLSEDIGRYLKNELVEARPPSTWYHIQKFYERNKLLASSLASIMIALSIGLAVALWGVARATTAYRDLRDKDAELRATLRAHSDTLLEQGVSFSLTENEEDARRVVKQLREFGGTDSADKLEAYIDIQVGNYTKAIQLLSQLASRKPNSAGASALLALAHDAAGDPMGYLQSYNRLCEATHDRESIPREDLFFLIKGFIWDPKQGVEFGKEAYKLGPSPFTLLELAPTKMDWANAAGRPDLIDGALKDIDAGRRVLRNSNSLSRLECLASYILAAKTAKAAGNNELYSTIMERAREFAIDIEEHDQPSNWELMFVGAYYREIKDFEQALEYHLRAVREHFSDFSVYYYIGLALETNSAIAEDVMARLKRKRVGPASSAAWAHFLIAEGDRNGAIEVADEIGWIEERLNVLRLAGKRLNRAQILALQDQLYRPPPRSPERRFYENFVAFHKDEISAETCIERARVGRYQKRWLAQSYWTIGIRELSEGHHDAALLFFRLVSEQEVFTGSHGFVDAYIAMLERSAHARPADDTGL